MASPLFDLSGKVAIVTGGTRGLGRAIVEALAQAGAQVLLCSENAADCERAEAELRAQGLAVRAQRCDVRSADDQQALVNGALALYGGLDIVVANAGITDPMVGTVALEEADYQRVMDINLHSVWRLCKLATPALKARGGGSLILMSSLSGQRGNGRIGVYALTKAALSQLARNLAVELGPQGIRANAIAPGVIRTDLAAGMLADTAFMARRMQATPLRRPGEPAEVAGPALLLASPAGAFITGQTLVVDGGTLISDGS